MKSLSLLIKPASSLCNMRCRYCFYHDLSRRRQAPPEEIMRQQTVRRVLDTVFQEFEGAAGRLTLIFQGGEPTLAGLDWFRAFVAYVSSVSAASSRKGQVVVTYALQTNGLLLDDAWAEFLAAHQFLVGLSIDALAAIHDANRIDARGAGTYEACLKARDLLEKYKVEYNILCVLTRALAREPDKVWHFIMDGKVRFIQFIPCLGHLDEKEKSPLAPGCAAFASFYIGLYQRWAAELETGTYISVKLFDDTANFFFRGIPSACGIDGRCRAHGIVESDGSVYPCDFYVLDQYRTGNLCHQTLREILASEQAQAFVNEAPGLPRLCRRCPYLERCGGGCKRMRDTMYAAGNGVVCGYRNFLDRCLAPLGQVVRRYFP
jgi:uncharacterized protein